MLQQAITNPASAQEGRNQLAGVPKKFTTAAHYGSVDDPDAALVSSLRARDAIAFDLLVKRHERRLLSVAMKVTKNREDAEDAVQESFLKVFKRLDTFRGDSRFLSWLTRITINEALMTVRAKPRKTASLDELRESEKGVTNFEPETGGYTPEQLCSEREFERLVVDRTAGMKQASRRVLELRAFEDLGDNEIAQVLGLTLPAVKARLFRARRELRKRMEKHMTCKDLSAGRLVIQDGRGQ
jgi:RNA polymerase sigma-70 factor, ECF subfamily